MKKVLLIIIICAIYCHVFAQTKKSKPTFQSYNTMGLIWGQNQSVPSFQSVNGFEFNKYFLGLGISFESYGSQSTPLFLELRRTFNKKFFIYTDLGMNVPWYNSTFPKKYDWSGMSAFTLKNSFYGEWGLGIKTPMNNQTSFVASIGYSIKTFNYTQHNLYWSGNGLVDGEFAFAYNRIAFRMGVQF